MRGHSKFDRALEPLERCEIDPPNGAQKLCTPVTEKVTHKSKMAIPFLRGLVSFEPPGRSNSGICKFDNWEYQPSTEWWNVERNEVHWVRWTT